MLHGERMDRHNLDVVGHSIVRDHHKCTPTLVMNFHNGNVAQAVMVIVSLLALTIDPLGHLFRDLAHADLEPQVSAVPDLHIALP
jgi:hypothetical protein